MLRLGGKGQGADRDNCTKYTSERGHGGDQCVFILSWYEYITSKKLGTFVEI